MSTDAAAVEVPSSDPRQHVGISSPPDSNPPTKNEGSDSELSDMEEPEEDIGEITPEYYADDGRVPVFKPTMEQFKSFKLYMAKVNPYGMKSGIVKVIPPPEWRAAMPPLDETIKTIKVKEPIKQDIMGTSGTYRQANILHQRSYNLPQWRQLCDQSDHQPPAKRGERRTNLEKAPKPATKPATKPKAAAKAPAKPKRGSRGKPKAGTSDTEMGDTPDRLLTPVSPSAKGEDDMEPVKQEDDADESPLRTIMRGRGGKAISVSSRRKYNRREAAAMVDEAAFKDFKYELEGEDYSRERCEELERAYWKTLTYAAPLYGADMPGSLFTDKTESWNLGKLENLLDVLGTKIPGVNTAYLYLGMWKATFAWHLEDVDLYSINFLHFGAPKQWYSISQGDARRFEAAMRTIWPADAKACDQFLRHKTFLISPSHLLSNFNIKVNKITHHPGEFVITFPYGYHSGYNLGYNCAEAVNFALDSWLEYGRVAKKCDCDQAQDSVWIDVNEIERKLRGEETDYDETDDEGEDDEDGARDLPTPPESSGDTKAKAQAQKRKRRRTANDKGEDPDAKRIKIRIKAPAKEPCVLCPNDIPTEPLLPTENGQKAHRLCAQYIPETSIESGNREMVVDVKYIDKARLDLKCNYCRSKKGACFQCSQKKCTRAYHATCAAAAGVFVEQGEIPVFGEDGTEYKEWAIEFSCRFHRNKRDKKLDGDMLEGDTRIRKAAAELKAGAVCQMQYQKGDIFAGTIVKNCKTEEMVLVDILPRGDRFEVEYKWLLIPEATDYHFPKPSENAIPLPSSRKAKKELNTSKRQADGLPRVDDIFFDDLVWAEFKTEKIERSPVQVNIDLAKENQIWYYLGKNSTEAKAQFTEDPAKPRHNPKGHFLDTIPKPLPLHRQVYAGATYPQNYKRTATTPTKPSNPASQQFVARSMDKPYNYKPHGSEPYRIDPQAYRSQQNFLNQSTAPYQFGSDPRWRPSQPPISSPLSRGPSPASTPYGTPHGSIPAAPYRQSSTPQVPPATKGSNPAKQYRQPSTPQVAPAPKGSKPSVHHRRPSQKSMFSSSFTNESQSSRLDLFAKYPYFQKEHNRASSAYKSPYRPDGGFMNGYQGSMDIKQMEELLFSRPNLTTPMANHLSGYESQYSSSSQPASTNLSGNSTSQMLSTSQTPSINQWSPTGQKSSSQPYSASQCSATPRPSPNPAQKSEQTHGLYHNLPKPAPSWEPVPEIQQAAYSSSSTHLPQMSKMSPPPLPLSYTPMPSLAPPQEIEPSYPHNHSLPGQGLQHLLQQPQSKHVDTPVNFQSLGLQHDLQQPALKHVDIPDAPAEPTSLIPDVSTYPASLIEKMTMVLRKAPVRAPTGTLPLSR